MSISPRWFEYQRALGLLFRVPFYFHIFFCVASCGFTTEYV